MSGWDRERRGTSSDGDDTAIDGDVAPGKATLASQLGRADRVLSSEPGRSMATDGLPRMAIARSATTRAPRKVPSQVTSALQHAQGAPLANPERWSQRVGSDVGDARIVTGEGAPEAAAAVGARAFTVGNRVFMGAGNDAATDGGGLLAHELTHVVQQRGAAKPGSWDQLTVLSHGDPREVAARSHDAGASAPNDLAIARDGETCDAATYVANHAADIQAGLSSRLPAIVVAQTGSPYATWGSAGAAALTQAIASSIAKTGISFARLAETLSPVSPKRAIDLGRDADSDMGPTDWNAAVIDELIAVYRPAILARVAVVMRSYVNARSRAVVAKQQKQNSEKKDDFATQPAPSEVIPLHPLDVPIIGALCSQDVVTVDLPALWKDHPEQQSAAATSLRFVCLELQVESGNWMWVRATLPPPALDGASVTPAEVAQVLYGTTTMAHLIGGAAPLFSFSLPPSGKLAEPYDSQWRAKIGSSATSSNADPTKASSANDPQQTVGKGGDPKLDAAKEMAASASSDEAAKAQGAALPPTGADAAAIAGRIRVTKSVVQDVKTRALTFGVGGELEGLIAKLEARAVAIVKDDLEAARWDGQSNEQAVLVQEAANGLDAAVEQVKSMVPASGSVPNLGSYATAPLKKVATAFVDCVIVSDLVGSARAKLQQARELVRTYPLDLVDAVLLHIRALIASHKGVGGEQAETDLMTNMQAQLRDEAMKLRELLTTDPAAAQKRIQGLQDGVGELEARATIVTNVAAFTKLLHQLASAKNDWWVSEDQRKKAVANLEPQKAKWDKLAEELKGKVQGDDLIGGKSNLPALRQKLAVLQQDSDLGKSLGEVNAVLADAAFKKQLATVAALVGVAIVTWGVGAGVEALGGGALLATGAEALTFTALSNAVMQKDVDIKQFLFEAGTNFAMIGGLKAVGKIFEVAAAGAKLTLPQKLVKYSIDNLIMTATQAAATEYEKRKAGKGDVSESEVAEIMLNNLAMQVGFGIAERMGKSIFASIKGLKGQTAKMRKYEDLRKAAEAAGKAVKDKPSAEVALNAEGKVNAKASEGIEELDKVAEKLTTDPKQATAELKALGVELDQTGADTLKQVAAEQHAIAQQQKLARLQLRIEDRGAGHYVADRPTLDELETAHKEAGNTVVRSHDGPAASEKPIDAAAAAEGGDVLDITVKDTGNHLKVHEKVGTTIGQPAVAADMPAWKVQAEQDWQLVQKERPNWTGKTKEEFFKEYEQGKRFNFDTGKYPRANAPQKDVHTFSADEGGKLPSSQDVVNYFLRENPKSFKQFFDVISKYIDVTEADLRLQIESIGFVGRSEDAVRHALKLIYKPRVMAKLLDKARWRATRPDLEWNGTPAEQTEALRTASNAEMIDLTGKLNPGDQGALAEEWYVRTHPEEMSHPETGKQTGVSQQPLGKGEVAKIDIDLTADRKVDFVIHNEILVEVKSGAGEFDWKEIDDYLRVASKPGGAVVKLKNGETGSLKWLKLAALNPAGALENAAKALERAETHTNFFFEATNTSGQTKVFSQLNLAELQDTAGFKAWLGL